MKYITLTAVSKRVAVSAYVKAVKVARANPTAEFKHGLTTWWPTTGAEIMKQFLSGIHDRINNGGHNNAKQNRATRHNRAVDERT